MFKKINYTIAAFAAAAVVIVTVVIALVISFTASKISRDVSDALRQTSQVCGRKGRASYTNAELAKAFKSAKDHVAGDNAIKFPAEKLIDGDPDTFAYSNSKQIDYSVDLVDLYPVEKVTIVWNEYGEKENYVSSYYLEGCDKSGNWMILERGGWPQSKQTTIKIDSEVLSEVRLHAQSKTNWIGAYEIIIE